jgi:hypothetical protein
MGRILVLFTSAPKGASARHLEPLFLIRLPLQNFNPGKRLGGWGKKLCKNLIAKE